MKEKKRFLNPMLKSGNILILLLVLGVASFAAFFFGSDAKRNISNTLLRLEQDANRAPKVAILEQLSIVKRDAAEFAEQLTVQIHDGNEEQKRQFTRKELEEHATAGLKANFSKLEVRLKNLRIEVKRPLATAQCELSVLGALPGAKGDFFENWDLEILLTSQDGIWLISEIRATNLRTQNS